MKTIFFAPMRLAPAPEKRPQPLLKMLWEPKWLQWAFFWVGLLFSVIGSCAPGLECVRTMRACRFVRWRHRRVGLAVLGKEDNYCLFITGGKNRCMRQLHALNASALQFNNGSLLDKGGTKSSQGEDKGQESFLGAGNPVLPFVYPFKEQLLNCDMGFVWPGTTCGAHAFDAFVFCMRRFLPPSAGAFCIQFGVGAWGVQTPLCDDVFPCPNKSPSPGVANQIGNMISSAVAQIEATGGDRLKTVLNGNVIPDYRKVQGILIGAVAAFLILITIIGSAEKHSSHFEKHRFAFE
ncbi:hypothetical protein B0H19DRAFT_1338996 [Mycena capillaripes]|nr:hypothetical protein B0H19DRAFT_1338996 [Mycena capillaripes]